MCPPNDISVLSQNLFNPENVNFLKTFMFLGSRNHAVLFHDTSFNFSGTSDFAEPASGMSLPQQALSWVWLVDLERTVALLVGRCLGGMLQGAPTSLEEQDTAYWLKTPLFSNGLEMEIPQLGR